MRSFEMNTKAITTPAKIAVLIVVVVIAAVAGYFLISPTGTTSMSQTTTAAATTAAATTQQPINIGIIAPLTGIGANHGAAMVNGFKLAAEEINGQGGVLGRRLNLIVQDEDDSSDMAGKAADLLISQYNVFAILGHYWTGGVSATMGYKPMPIDIQTAASADFLMNNVITDPTDYNGMFRVGFSDSSMAFLAANWVTQIINAKTVWYVAEDYQWAHEVHDFLLNSTSSNGVTIAAADYFQSSTTDYTAEVAKIALAKPDATVVIMSGTNGIYFYKQYAANPATKKIPIFSVYTEFQRADIVQSTETAQPGSTQYIGTGIQFDYTNKTAAYEAKYYQTYGVQSDLTTDGRAYDALYVLANAINSAGVLDKNAVIAALEKTDYVGVCGIIRFTARHDLVYGPGGATGMIWQWVNTSAQIVWPKQLANATWVPPQ